ncbi:unnamed protein product, partial [Closterium sp. Naga37s-1]
MSLIAGKPLPPPAKPAKASPPVPANPRLVLLANNSFDAKCLDGRYRMRGKWDPPLSLSPPCNSSPFPHIPSSSPPPSPSPRRPYDLRTPAPQDLKSNRGIKSADQILLVGSSAGGQAIVAFCDRIAAAFPWAATKCISDSGFFIDSKDRLGGNTWRASAQMLVDFHKPKWTDCMD